MAPEHERKTAAGRWRPRSTTTSAGLEAYEGETGRGHAARVISPSNRGAAVFEGGSSLSGRVHRMIVECCNVAVNLIDLGTSLAAFFEEGQGPSHDELDRAFVATKLNAGDPAPGGSDPWGKPVGKMKRLRSVFDYSSEHDTEAGIRLGQRIVALLRSAGTFSSAGSTYAGTDKIDRLRASFDRAGFVLDANGVVRAKVIDNLEGTDLTEWLKVYVDRLNANPDDVPLQIGTGKELDEATARHVIELKTGTYPVGRGANFPYTLSQAFYLVGLSQPAKEVALDADPHKAVQQCLFLLAKEVNRLRNDAGTGHGRPSAPEKTAPLSQAEARLVARATALVAGALLDNL